MLDIRVLLEAIVAFKNRFVQKYLVNPLEIIFQNIYRLISNKSSKDDQDSCLFGKDASIFNKDLRSTNLMVKSCAVDEFDFLQDSNNDQIPFNWDLNNLIELPPYLQAQASSSVGIYNLDPSHQHPHMQHQAPQQQQQHQAQNYTAIFNSQDDDFETALDEELTFVNRSKFQFYPYVSNEQPFPPMTNSFVPQQHIKLEESAFYENLALNNSNLILSSSTVSSNDDEFIKRDFEEEEESMIPPPQLQSSDLPFKTKKKSKALTSSSTSTINSSGIIKSKPTIFQCPHCEANFKVKGYLTRHMKKHSNSKAFLCPFYSSAMSDSSPDTPSSESTTSTNISMPHGKSGTNCHPTGGFSRRDTFKTHLKALHFIYPPGTKSASRSAVGGRCAGCFTFFETNSIWLTEHIESNACPSMLHRCS